MPNYDPYAHLVSDDPAAAPSGAGDPYAHLLSPSGGAAPVPQEPSAIQKALGKFKSGLHSFNEVIAPVVGAPKNLLNAAVRPAAQFGADIGVPYADEIAASPDPAATFLRSPYNPEGLIERYNDWSLGKIQDSAHTLGLSTVENIADAARGVNRGIAETTAGLASDPLMYTGLGEGKLALAGIAAFTPGMVEGAIEHGGMALDPNLSLRDRSAAGAQALVDAAFLGHSAYSHLGPKRAKGGAVVDPATLRATEGDLGTLAQNTPYVDTVPANPNIHEILKRDAAGRQADALIAQGLPSERQAADVERRSAIADALQRAQEDAARAAAGDVQPRERTPLPEPPPALYGPDGNIIQPFVPADPTVLQRLRDANRAETPSIPRTQGAVPANPNILDVLKRANTPPEVWQGDTPPAFEPPAEMRSPDEVRADMLAEVERQRAAQPVQEPPVSTDSGQPPPVAAPSVFDQLTSQEQALLAHTGFKGRSSIDFSFKSPEEARQYLRPLIEAEAQSRAKAEAARAGQKPGDGRMWGSLEDAPPPPRGEPPTGGAPPAAAAAEVPFDVPAAEPLKGTFGETPEERQDYVDTVLLNAKKFGNAEGPGDHVDPVDGSRWLTHVQDGEHVAAARIGTDNVVSDWVGKEKGHGALVARRIMRTDAMIDPEHLSPESAAELNEAIARGGRLGEKIRSRILDRTEPGADVGEHDVTGQEADSVPGPDPGLAGREAPDVQLPERPGGTEPGGHPATEGRVRPAGGEGAGELAEPNSGTRVPEPRTPPDQANFHPRTEPALHESSGRYDQQAAQDRIAEAEETGLHKAGPYYSVAQTTPEMAPVAKALAGRHDIIGKFDNAARAMGKAIGVQAKLLGLTTEGVVYGHQNSKGVRLNPLSLYEAALEHVQRYNPKGLVGPKAREVLAKEMARRAARTLMHEVAHYVVEDHGPKHDITQRRMIRALSNRMADVRTSLTTAFLSGGKDGVRYVDLMGEHLGAAQKHWGGLERERSAGDVRGARGAKPVEGGRSGGVAPPEARGAGKAGPPEGVRPGRGGSADAVPARADVGRGGAADVALAARKPPSDNIDPATLSKAVLDRMSRALKAKGYDMRGAEDVRKYMDRQLEGGKFWNGDWQDAYDQATGSVTKQADKAATLKERTPNVDWDTVRRLGTTTDPRVAGYIRPDGKLLDLSGGRSGGTRGEDHRIVGGYAALQEIKAAGYVRFSPGFGFDIGAEPTPESYRQISRLAESMPGRILVDLAEGLGELSESGEHRESAPRRTSLEYPEGTKAAKILGDIRRFYAGEDLPGGTRFHERRPLKPIPPTAKPPMGRPMEPGEAHRVDTKVADLEGASPADEARLSRNAPRTWESLDPKIQKVIDHATESQKAQADFYTRARSGRLNDVEVQALDGMVRGARESMESARAALEKAQKEGRDTGPENVAVLRAALDQAVNDFAKASRSDVEAGTKLARALAARARVMEAAGRSTPEQFLREVFKKMDGVTDEQAAALVHKMQADPGNLLDTLQGVMRSTTSSKLIEAWKQGLISAPGTQIANIMGNLTEVPARLAETVVASALDSLGGNSTRLRGEAGHELRGAWTGAMKGLDPLLKELSDIVHLRPEKITTSNLEHIPAIPGKAGRAIRTPGRILEAADQFFQSIGHNAELYKLAFREAKGNVAEAQRFIDKPPKAMREAAEASALARTYKDPNKLAEVALRLRASHPAMHVILPFVVTPANIARLAFERTPAGFVKGVKALNEYNRAVKSGADAATVNRLRGQALDHMARPLVGSAIMGTFFLAAKSGLMTGSGPTDQKEKNLLLDSGWQPYSFALPIGEDGKRVYVPYNRLEPVSSLLGIAADMAEIQDQRKLGDMADKALGSIGSNFLSKTFLTGLSDAANAIARPQEFASQYVSSLAGSVVPNIIAKGAQALDSTVRDTKPTSTGLAGIPERVGKSLMARIPGASMALPARKTALGDDVERPGNALTRFLLPSQVTADKDGVGQLEHEMSRIGFAPSAPARTIQTHGQKVQLTDEEFQKLTAAYKRAAEYALRLIQSPSYKGLPDSKDEGPRSKEKMLEEYFDKIVGPVKSQLARKALLRSRAS